MTTILETERLRLRPVELSDAAFIQHSFGQPEVLQFLPPEVPNPYPADGAVFYLSQIMLPAMQAGTAMEFLILRKHDDAPMGAVMLENKGNGRDEWRRGFWLAKHYHGQRYMEEASLAALRWFFTNTPATAVVTGNALSNHASARIKEKQGFLPLGTRVQIPPFHNGETTAMDWKLTRERFLDLHGVVTLA